MLRGPLERADTDAVLLKFPKQLPLLLAISAYIFVWPPRFLKRPELFRDLDRAEIVETAQTKATTEKSPTTSAETR